MKKDDSDKSGDSDKISEEETDHTLNLNCEYDFKPANFNFFYWN